MRRLLLGLLFAFAMALAGCEGEERGERYPYGYAPQDGYYGPYGYVPPDGYYDGRARDGYERRGENEAGEEREERTEGERRARIQLSDRPRQLEIIVAE